MTSRVRKFNIKLRAPSVKILNDSFFQHFLINHPSIPVHTPISLHLRRFQACRRQTPGTLMPAPPDGPALPAKPQLPTKQQRTASEIP